MPGHSITPSGPSPFQGAQGCYRTVFQKANICTVVTITPDVTCLPPTVCCIGHPTFGGPPCPGSPSCSFTVNQEVGISIPMEFDAIPTCSTFIIDCKTPTNDPCTDGCTP